MKALEANGLRSHAVEMSLGPFSLLSLSLDDAEACVFVYHVDFRVDTVT